MSTTLKQPQLFLDWLVPAGREKFRPAEVAQILSPDDGQAPVSEKSIRNAMDVGNIFGNRIPLSSPVGAHQRIRLEWISRVDLLQALLVTRTAAPAIQVDQLCQIATRLPPEAQDELARYLHALRIRRPLKSA